MLHRLKLAQLLATTIIFERRVIESKVTLQLKSSLTMSNMCVDKQLVYKYYKEREMKPGFR